MPVDKPVPGPTVTLDPPPALKNNPDRDRYELWSGDELVGIEAYEKADGGNIVLLHTVVTEKYGRAGFARLLVSEVLDDITAHHMHAVPVCSYVKDFVERFPQYQDAIAERPE